MSIYISNLVCGIKDGVKNIALIEEIVRHDPQSSLGIELFVHTHIREYKKEIKELVPVLRGRKITFHGPFLGVEATSKPGTSGYDNFIESYLFAYELGKEFGSKHIVFHTNERRISPEDKKDLQEISRQNIRTLLDLSAKYGIQLLIENIPIKGVPLYDMEEYIGLFDEFPEAGCIIDIGHVHLAGWDMETIVSRLQSRIQAYHIHNNDSIQDSHCRMQDGTLNLDDFLRIYNQYTPEAELILEYSDEQGISKEDIIEDINYLRQSTKNRP